ncbi:MAG: ABC transporter permease [Dongiaceae bacterium]
MRDWRTEKQAFTIFTLPGAFWLIVFFTLPLCIVWAYSFLDRGPQGQIEWGVVTFANYVRAIEPIHLGIIWKSIWIAAITTFLCIAVGFPMAMGIAFAAPQWKNPLLLLVALPFFTNLLIRTYAWIAILRTKGYLNATLEWGYDQVTGLLGLVGGGTFAAYQPFEFLYNQQAVIVGLVYVNLPFLILPLYATLEKLDRSFLEASLDLGATQWRTFFSVLAPLALPGIVSGSLLVFILSLGSYLTPNLLGGTDSEMIGTLIARQFGASRDFPFGSALSFLLLYATFILLWLRASIAQRSQGVGA